VLLILKPLEFKTGQNLKIANDEFEFWCGTSIRRQDWTFEKKNQVTVFGFAVVFSVYEFRSNLAIFFMRKLWL